MQYTWYTNSTIDLIFSGHVDPQYVERGICSVKSDVYGFGVTMLEILSGKNSSFFISFQDRDLSSQVSIVIPNQWTTPVRSTCISNPENANFD